MIQCKIGGKNCSHDDLPLCPDIPESHLKCHGNAQGRDQQRYHNADRSLDRHLTPEGSAYNCLIHSKWVKTDDQEEDSSCQQGKQHGSSAQDHGLFPGKLRPLHCTQQRFPSCLLTCFHLCSPPSPLSFLLLLS